MITGKMHSVDGTLLNYRIFGQGTEVVTCLHPLALDGSWYEDLAAAMGQDRRYLCPDFRGHGGTQFGPTRVTLDLLAEDVAALWYQLGNQSSTVLGVSLGGMVAQALATRHRASVDSLVLMGTTARFDEQSSYHTGQRAALARSDGGMAKLLEPTLRRWFDEDTIRANERLVELARASLTATDGEVHGAFLDAMRELDYIDSSPEWASPPATLVIGGEHDTSATPAVTKALAAAVPGAELAMTPGGHLAMFENVRQAADLVNDFLVRQNLDSRDSAR
ncbi:alpha/beta fold hydrolase [Rhodococcus tukisamuensis]|uniref:3-oxoadipate enol-lactonase n=1 Tax=Rhodococcus tukisamuensis TaxID=168276 RepID=A0A1G7ERF1_9NOCA|nr:alpha/beta hydrolase [Rhodococcus tukisamuensis]SDE66233.1 3-oxoadipate enol-lactonase [Rhodococcus tukisamuensis]